MLEVKEFPFELSDKELMFMELKPDHWTWGAWLQAYRKWKELDSGAVVAQRPDTSKVDSSNLSCPTE